MGTEPNVQHTEGSKYPYVHEARLTTPALVIAAATVQHTLNLFVHALTHRSNWIRHSERYTMTGLEFQEQLRNDPIVATAQYLESTASR
jgi:hypothetical protein